MKYPLTCSVIVVQLDAISAATALIAVRTDNGKVKLLSTELNLGTLSDATDPQMWAQMVMASVCDGL